MKRGQTSVMGKTYRKNKTYFDDDYEWNSDFKVEGRNKRKKKIAKQIRQDRKQSDDRKFKSYEVAYE